MILFGRWSPSVALRKRPVLQTKLWKMRVVWFLVTVSMLISKMTLSSKIQSKVLIIFAFLISHGSKSGLNTVTEDIKHILQQLHRYGSDSLKLQELDQTKQRIDAFFQESSLTSSANADDVMTLTKAYHKYKSEYVKQLVFTPQKENLSNIHI